MAKRKKKIYKLTPEIRRRYNRLMSLEKSKEALSTPTGPFWNKKIDVQALISITKSHGEARASLWTEVVSEYPELNGKDATANDHGIQLS